MQFFPQGPNRTIGAQHLGAQHVGLCRHMAQRADTLAPTTGSTTLLDAAVRPHVS